MQIENEIRRFPGKKQTMTVRDRVLNVIATESLREVRPGEFDARFVELGVDSLDMVCILFGLEKEFSLSLAEERVRSLVTVRQLVEYIERMGLVTPIGDSPVEFWDPARPRVSYRPQCEPMS
jgi:acyl carrier protein